MKPHHCGMAARTCIWCADLAHAGLRPTPTILEGVDGFFQLFGGVATNTVEYDDTESWSILDPGIHFKRYACCSSMGPALDALLESPEVAGLDPASIISVEVGETPWAYNELIYSSPASATGAKLSMEYAVAAALVCLKIFNDDAAVLNPEIQSLMSRVRTRVDEEFAARDFNADASVKIVVTLEDGTSIRLLREYAKGNVRSPLTEDELREKYDALVAPVIGASCTEKLLIAYGTLKTWTTPQACSRATSAPGRRLWVMHDLRRRPRR